MNRKLLSLLVALMLIFTIGSVVYADEEKEDVEPNRYEKREINIQNDFQHNLIEKQELPEEQKELTFERPKQTESEQITDELFQTSVIETNTITTKAAQLELFSMPDEGTKLDIKEETVNDSNLLMILMIVVTIVIIAVIFFLIPKLKHTQD